MAQSERNVTTQSDWLSYSLSSAQMATDKYRVTFNWEFINGSPISKFRDGMGITHDANTLNESENALYHYQTDYFTSSGPVFQDNHPAGVGFAINLNGSDPASAGHRGNMSVPLYSSGSADSGTAYGHFIHSNTPSWFQNISLGMGVFSISGIQSSSEIDAPRIELDW